MFSQVLTHMRRQGGNMGFKEYWVSSFFTVQLIFVDRIFHWPGAHWVARMASQRILETRSYLYLSSAGIKAATHYTGQLCAPGLGMFITRSLVSLPSPDYKMLKPTSLLLKFCYPCASYFEHLTCIKHRLTWILCCPLGKKRKWTLSFRNGMFPAFIGHKAFIVRAGGIRIDPETMSTFHVFPRQRFPWLNHTRESGCTTLCSIQ